MRDARPPLHNLDLASPAGAGSAPVFHVALRLEGERCLVVGGGPVAARKAASLLAAAAHVVLVAPSVGREVRDLQAVHGEPALVVEQRRYRAGEAAASGEEDEDGGGGGGDGGDSGDGGAGRTGREEGGSRERAPRYRLVVTATGVPEVDRQVSLDAQGGGVLVNAADQPQWCTFFLPSVARRGDVSVAVSTGGVSPFAASMLRRHLERALGPEVGELVALLGEVRSRVRGALVPTEGLDWESLAGELAPLLRAGRRAEAGAVAGEWCRAVLAPRPAAAMDRGR